MGKSLFFTLLLVLLWSCSKKSDTVTSNPPDPPPSGNQDIVAKNLTTGALVEVSSGSVSGSATTVKVSKPNTPVDRVEISIPANSFTNNPTLKISYAEIKGHQFGPNFNPISPIINFSCDGGYSNDLMSITVPVKIPQGHIPIGFFYDETTGKLEGIPFKSITTNSITLLTRHFLAADKLKSGSLQLKSASFAGANIIVSSISESVLNGQPVIASGFKPGTDDWEFVNWGSYIATGGHCAGQNIAAMWYYFEKKPTMGSLNNRLSDIPAIWQDNARGYRFCSVIHNDLVWDGFVTSMFDKYIDTNQSLDKLKLLTIAGAMLVTGEPQGIGIYQQNGTKPDGTPTYAGHDLICYQVSVSGGKLYISDPNTPGTLQSINFANEKFSPYVAKTNGNTPATPYQYITYYAKTAYIEWNKIGKRWEEVMNNTIGTVAPNTFPAYKIWVKGTAGDAELADGMSVTNDSLRTYVECPTAVTFVNSNGMRLISSEVYGGDGKVISKQNSPGVTNWSLSTGLLVKLLPGANKLGYYIVGWNAKVLYDKSTERIPLFIDFKWITVNYMPLAIDPNPLSGALNTEYTFTARSKGTAPKSSKYIWDFGDGTVKVTMQNDSTAKHTFAKEGTFNVKVELYDAGSNKKISEAGSKAIIAPAGNSLDNLHKTKKIIIFGKCSFLWASGKDASNMNFGNANDDSNPIKWNNRDFSAVYTKERVDPYSKTVYTYSFTGTVSDDGKKILSFSHDYKATYYAYNQFDGSQAYKYTATNIPLTEAYNYQGWRSRYLLPKVEVASHITSFDWHEVSSDGKTKWDYASMKQFDDDFYILLYE